MQLQWMLPDNLLKRYAQNRFPGNFEIRFWASSFENKSILILIKLWTDTQLKITEKVIIS
jgi:hypothetical protein